MDRGGEDRYIVVVQRGVTGRSINYLSDMYECK